MGLDTTGTAYAHMGQGQRVIAGMLRQRDTASTERYTHFHNAHGAGLVEDRWRRIVGSPDPDHPPDEDR